MVDSGDSRSVAERIVYGALDHVGQRNKSAESLELLDSALENVSPLVEVKSRRVGGATYQVPVEVRPKRRDTLAMRWLIDAARKRDCRIVQLTSDKQRPDALRFYAALGFKATHQGFKLKL